MLALQPSLPPILLHAVISTARAGMGAALPYLLFLLIFQIQADFELFRHHCAGLSHSFRPIS
jgi:hypothetical protein